MGRAGLAPLVEVIPPREAPATIWPEIEARIDALEEVLLTPQQVTAQIVGIKRRLSRWRAAAVTATALAASLLLFVGYREIVHPPERDARRRAAEGRPIAGVPRVRRSRQARS